MGNWKGIYNPLEYYLNHVGYKAGQVHLLPGLEVMYYLNHVGYKEGIL